MVQSDRSHYASPRHRLRVTGWQWAVGRVAPSPDLKMVSQASVCACHTLVLRRLCSSTGVTIIFPKVLIICKKHGSLNTATFSLSLHSPWRGRILTQTLLYLQRVRVKGHHLSRSTQGRLCAVFNKKVSVSHLVVLGIEPRISWLLKKHLIHCVPLLFYFYLETKYH